MVPPGGEPNPGIPGAHVFLILHYGNLDDPVDDTWTDDYGDYDFGDTNISAAYDGATITVIVDEGTGHEQSQSVEYLIPGDPGIPFIAYDEFIFYPVPDHNK
jgi:hypothetical protein